MEIMHFTTQKTYATFHSGLLFATSFIFYAMQTSKLCQEQRGNHQTGALKGASSFNLPEVMCFIEKYLPSSLCKRRLSCVWQHSAISVTSQTAEKWRCKEHIGFDIIGILGNQASQCVSFKTILKPRPQYPTEKWKFRPITVKLNSLVQYDLVSPITATFILRFKRMALKSSR